MYLGTCGDPTPANGTVIASNFAITNGQYTVGIKVSFTCDSGYNMIGSNFSSCSGIGSWNPLPPTCQKGNVTM